MATKPSGVRNLTTASELESLLGNIGIVSGRLSAVLRAAYAIEGNSRENINDRQCLIGVAVDLARSAEEQNESADTMAVHIRQWLEDEQKSGDRLQG